MIIDNISYLASKVYDSGLFFFFGKYDSGLILKDWLTLGDGSRNITSCCLLDPQLCACICDFQMAISSGKIYYFR